MANAVETTPIINLADARAAEDRRQRLKELEDTLKKSDRGAVLATGSNLQLIINFDPVLAGLCGYNEFICAPVLHRAPPLPYDEALPAPGPYPRPWTDADVSYVSSYIERVWTDRGGPLIVERAMEAVANTHRFHPVRDWLATLVWDGVPRIERWLQIGFGAPNDSYHNDAGAKLLIASVRRVRRPGCKFDHMAVFEGPQGIGKSTVVKALYGGDWFTDALPAKLESADAGLGLQGVWCVEFAEIEQIIRAEVEIIKAFLSRSVDRFRAPYGRRFLTYPRQCVLVGTTNDTAYLRDTTGNRRFWPLKCPIAAPGWVAENRDQLWAEAAARESEGADHWLTEVESIRMAGELQFARVQDDPWDEPIGRFVEHLTTTTIPEVLSHQFHIEAAAQTKRDQMRVAECLKKLGWLRQVQRDPKAEGGSGQMRRFWVKNETGGNRR